MKKSNSINWLRCLATLLITNSHFDTLYPQKLSFLAFGGLFGNCIFFLVSGYCLANITTAFPKWYAKRVIKVYIPYLIFIPFMLIAGWKLEPWWYIIFPIEPYHFLPAILALYPVYYLIVYLADHTKLTRRWILVFTVVVQLCYFFLVSNKQAGDVAKENTNLGIISYLIAMQIGGLLKTETFDIKPAVSLAIGVAMMVLYLLQRFLPISGALRILQWESCLVFAFFIGAFFISMEERLPRCKFIDLLASMTLEIYLVQWIAISAFSAVAFPTGMIYCLAAIFGTAYLLHLVSGFVIDLIYKPQKLENHAS